MNILFVKLGSIGDVVHTLPALAAVRRAVPGAKISWVVERGAAEILKDNPLLETLIEVDTKGLRREPLSGETLSSLWRQLRRLRASPFDLSIDFQGNFKSSLVGQLVRARRRYGFRPADRRRERASSLFPTRTVRIPSHVNVISKNLALASGALRQKLPAESGSLEFPVHVSPQHEREADAVVQRAGERFTILNPAGGWVTKLWDVGRYGELADALLERHGLRSVVTYGPGERALAERVVNASRTGAAHAESPTLKGMYALARRAAVYVGGDTGPTHIAVAAGAPVVGLFGPTEWWRNGSPREEDICVERLDIGCRTNCHRRTCSNWICMEIGVEKVLTAVGERLRRAEKARSAGGGHGVGA
jgi:heptosyltransferase I